MKRKTLLQLFLGLLILGFFIPQTFFMPVVGANGGSYSQNSFWAYPWGASITHKGVDIFSKKGTAVHSATYGWVVYRGEISRGGKVVLVLGPKWRLHYYAHLDSISATLFSLVGPRTLLGTVGNTGNAKGKPAHLHYSIKTIIPYPWQIDGSVQGWRKMFYLNPIPYLNQSLQ